MGIEREDDETQATKLPQPKRKRVWALIALVIVVAFLIGGELAFQRAKHRGWSTYTTTDGLAGDDVTSIAVAPEGALWFGTWNGGVSRFDGQTWITYTEDDGMASDSVYNIVVTPDGALWFGTRGGGVSRFDGETWTTFTEDDGLAGSHVSSIAVAPDGALWFGTGRQEEDKFVGSGVSRFDGETWTTYTEKDGLADDRVYGIVVGPDGALWFRTMWLSEWRAVSRFDGETWTTRVNTRMGDDEVLSMAVASDGALWFRGRYQVSRFDGETWTTHSGADGLAGGYIYGIAVAPDGVVWVGSSGGVSRFDGQTWSPYTATYSGLAEGYVESLFADSQGRVWAGAGGGLSVFDENVGLSGQTLRTWATAWDVLRILGIIALLVLLEIWIVRRDIRTRKEALAPLAQPASAKLPSVGLGAVGSLAGVALFSVWGLPRLNEAVGEGMIMMLLIGPILAVVCLVLGAVAGWVSARMASSKWGALIAGLIVGLVAASVTYFLMIAAFV